MKLTMSKIVPNKSTLLGLLFLWAAISPVDGHCLMKSPRSRNWFAYEEGVNGAQAALPPKDYCSFCLNTNEGVCGKNSYNNYDTYSDSLGNPMPWNSQEVYTEGQIITVKSDMYSHHNGHMIIRACPLGSSSTEACFDQPGNHLHFVEDVLYGMPKDEFYPERGYYSGGQASGLSDFEMKFKLPNGVYGDEVLLQWKYITANSCSPPGYVEYFGGRNSDNVTLDNAFWTPGLGSCVPPYPTDGSRSTSWPEQFWSCAEVTIIPASPSATPSPTPVPPAPVTTTVTPPASSPVAAPTSAEACCTIDFKNCSPSVTGWCSENEAQCTGPCDKFWLPNGPLTGCAARWESCNSDADCCSPGVCDGGQCALGTTSPSPVPAPSPAAPVSTTTAPPTNPTCLAQWGDCQNDPCCDGLTCVVVKCNGQFEKQCVFIDDHTTTAVPTTETPVSTTVVTSVIPSTTGFPSSSTEAATTLTTPDATTESPTTSSSTTTAPTTTSATTSGMPRETLSSYSCSAGSSMLSPWQALQEMEPITAEVSSNPYVLSVLSSGGAAGAGSNVVSESQAYGVLAAALVLATMDEGDLYYDATKEKFIGYFNGWKKMCENSAGSASCQSPIYCDGGSVPCLPGWKHTGDLSSVVGTGAAPDGDEDAIAGMIIALKAVEDDSVLPSWYDEVQDWADRSATQFLQDNTKLSSTGNHRLVKLGSCWGGWNSDGNNPSYHSPGQYRMFRDFQASIPSRGYSIPSLGDNLSLAEQWDMVIDTSYKFFETTQCPSSGLVPNWALVEETSASSLSKRDGSFSGSGTPQYEFGSEASRTMWRVAFDALVYPEEAASQAGDFLAPLFDLMVDNFDPNPTNGWEYFGHNTLQDCSGSPGYVSNVFGSWQWNGFIFSPVYSTLAVQMPPSTLEGKSFSQQDMVDKACGLVSTISGETSYYPRSWQVLATLTLNGAVAKAGELMRGTSAPTTPTAPTPVPPTSTTEAPPTAAPTQSPTPATGGNGCCSQDFKTCVTWCGDNPTKQECESCTADVYWLSNGPPAGSCFARWGDCTGDTNGCCSGLTCEGDENYSQCLPA